jgi:L-threonylcarbamoyladenylate synthase
LSQAQLSFACGQRVLTQAAYAGHEAVGSAPRASGMLASHYAPNAKVRLLTALAMQQAKPGPGLKVGIWTRSPISQPPQGAFIRVMPNDPQACARELFAQLREFEALGVAEIWVEPPPVTAEWDGIRDRLARAAVPTQAQAR